MPEPHHPAPATHHPTARHPPPGTHKVPEVFSYSVVALSDHAPGISDLWLNLLVGHPWGYGTSISTSILLVLVLVVLVAFRPDSKPVSTSLSISSISTSISYSHTAPVTNGHNGLIVIQSLTLLARMVDQSSLNSTELQRSDSPLGAPEAP